MNEPAKRLLAPENNITWMVSAGTEAPPGAERYGQTMLT